MIFTHMQFSQYYPLLITKKSGKPAKNFEKKEYLKRKTIVMVFPLLLEFMIFQNRVSSLLCSTFVKKKIEKCLELGTSVIAVTNRVQDNQIQKLTD